MTRLLIADDETLLREALAMMLGLEDDLEVVAVAASGGEAVAQAARHEPDVAVLDLQMPDLDGIEAAARIMKAQPGTACLIVTSHGRPGFLKQALSAGISGFLPKTVPATVLAHAVREVAAGRRYVDPHLAAEAISAGDSPLTPRESDVLALASQGGSVEEIARRASLSHGTVRNYLSSAAGKLGATNRHEAARIAAERGWI